MSIFDPSVEREAGAGEEVNIGVGWGTTASTDHLIAKGILGRYFNWGDWKRREPVPRPK